MKDCRRRVWQQPTGLSYSFGSFGAHTIRTGLGDLVGFSGTGQTIARSDPVNAAFNLLGLDTINTEIQSLVLTGTSVSSPFGTHAAQLRAGANNGIFPGLSPTRGEVQDKAGSPVDGNIDFPANSVFDVFFDFWIDLDDSGGVDVGEVFSNDTSDTTDFAARMSTAELANIPPPSGFKYVLVEGVDENDPFLGTFCATLFGSAELYPIDPARDRLPLPITLELLNASHTPEPATAIAGFACLIPVVIGTVRRWRKSTR